MNACPCRKATVKAAKNLVVLALDRATFVDILGPLQEIMDKEKSADVSGTRGWVVYLESTLKV